jgi:hypothetical protein
MRPRKVTTQEHLLDCQTEGMRCGQGADPNVAAAGWTALPWVSTAWETGTANGGKCHAKDHRGRMGPPRTPMHTLLTDLDRAILASRASTSVEVRASVADYCRALTRDRSTPNPFTGALAVWVEKVARHAYKTLPAEVTALRDEGLSEDEIFELTVAAAYGAARGRYDQALTALEEGYRP